MQVTIAKSSKSEIYTCHRVRKRMRPNRGSNTGFSDYPSDALPVELPGRHCYISPLPNRGSSQISIWDESLLSRGKCDSGEQMAQSTEHRNTPGSTEKLATLVNKT